MPILDVKDRVNPTKAHGLAVGERMIPKKSRQECWEYTLHDANYSFPLQAIGNSAKLPEFQSNNMGGSQVREN